MTQHTIQSEIDRENDRQSRIETQLAVMPPHQKKRLEAAQREAELGLANGSALAKLSIDHADAQLRESLRREALDGMNPVRKMAMARDGTLDAHLEQAVKERLEARSVRQ